MVASAIVARTVCGKKNSPVVARGTPPSQEWIADHLCELRAEPSG